MARKTKPALAKPKAMKSNYERKVAAYLTKEKVPFEYETLKIPFVVPAKKRVYNPDFMLPNGIIVEAKGNLDRAAREKMALVMEQNPHLDIRMLFMRNNRIMKTSKTKYSDWCEKRGITYAIDEDGRIPLEWLEEARADTSLDGSASVRRKGPRAVDSGVSDNDGGLDNV
jgi:hypothetical protein